MYDRIAYILICCCLGRRIAHLATQFTELLLKWQESKKLQPLWLENVRSSNTQGCSLLLFVDDREPEKHDRLIDHIQRNGIECERKHLRVGDYLWVIKNPQDGSEFVVNPIIERKTWDDLRHAFNMFL